MHSPGVGGAANREAFEAAMKTVDVTFQNLDSSEISLTDVSIADLLIRYRVDCWVSLPISRHLANVRYICVDVHASIPNVL